MWWHHPQKTSFLSLFGEFFSQIQGICDRMFRFQKTVSPFGDFSPKINHWAWHGKALCDLVCNIVGDTFTGVIADYCCECVLTIMKFSSQGRLKRWYCCQFDRKPPLDLTHEILIFAFVAVNIQQHRVWCIDLDGRMGCRLTFQFAKWSWKANNNRHVLGKFIFCC